jgi:hypothetical protein
MAHRRLRSTERLHQLARADLAAGDQRQQPQAHRVGQHLEGGGQLLGVVLAQHGGEHRLAAGGDLLHVHDKPY